MATYKLTLAGCVREDGLSIPNNQDNRHWREFLAWQAAGNTPDPIDPDPPPTQDQIDAAIGNSPTEETDDDATQEIV